MKEKIENRIKELKDIRSSCEKRVLDKLRKGYSYNDGATVLDDKYIHEATSIINELEKLLNE